MMRLKNHFSPSRSVWLLLVLLPTSLACSWSQAGSPGDPSQGNASSSWESSVAELQRQVRELQASVQQIHAEAAQYRAETLALKKELEIAEKQLASKPEEALENPESESKTEKTAAAPAGEVPELANVKEEQQLLSEKIDEQYQTKIESASKYRVRLSGIVLLNLFNNRGSVDNLDVPSIALQRSGLDSRGSFGGTLRQSELGLEVFGPRLAGARTTGDVQFDFAGGFPNDSNGVTEGIVRLRTGTLRLDWKNTSIVGGQDALFFSPLSPTSFASLSIPALAYAGNLWTWTPQLRVEHRIDFSETSRLLLQAGILDPLTGELPAFQYSRQPQAGERSGQPGYGARVAWTSNIFGRSVTTGVGGFYSRQDWGFRRNVTAWAGTADWSVPLNRWLSLTGEFYRGRALGGLGGGLGRSVFFNGSLSDPATVVQGLNSLGGWTQLKFKPPDSKFEFNAALGQENPFTKDVRGFAGSQNYFDATLVRNQSSFANIIYRPRSDLLFSVEYRHLRTFAVSRDSETANHINTMMGITF